MQRMTRLARWLELSFGETDLLLDAALQAEYGSAGRGEEITENTLRALGLFRRLRRDFKVSAEDFAALLQGVALYARGSEIPQFDRVFNDPTLFSEPLVLDGDEFNIVPGNEVEYRKIHHLCAALGIDYETYLYLARYIAQAMGQGQKRQKRQGEVLNWSHAVVSAFYRLARLPAWLGLSSIEALALLQLVGERGHQYVSRLVCTTLATHQHSELSDSLSVIQSLADTVQWCREHDLGVSWLYQHLMPLAPVAAASDRELDLLRQINGRMLPTILSEAVFRDAGLPMISGTDLPTPIDWLRQLQDFVSDKGLILELSEYLDSEDYEAALKSRLESIVDNLELEEGPHVVMRVFQLVMDARSAQHSLVWESLASTFGGSAELSQEVLAWAGGNSYQLLDEVLRLFSGALEPLPIPIGDEVLALFARLNHRMGIVAQLSLSPLALRSWRLHPEWFEGQGAGDSGEVTFARLHLLTQYRYLLEFTQQAEKALLDYLKLVHNLPPELTEQDLQLIREDAAGKVAQFTGFGIRDILETALEITENGFVSSVRQLDHLVRVRRACETLQLGSSAALELSRLRSNSSRQAYRAAAESALSSLEQQSNTPVPPTQGELGQSESSWIVVDYLRLVAKAGGRARCLLTVKNFLGQPVADVSVRWQTSLSQLDAPSSDTTDGNGQVWVDLLAGEEMGIAQVTARFGLDRQILAPLVLIDCEVESLFIQNPTREPGEALAGNLQAIDYRLEVLDELGNLGRDQIVEWSTDLGTFERPQTRTDANGIATARLLSRSSGVAIVHAHLPINDELEPFEPVTFLEQQYFQYVRFSGPVAATQVTSATCRVVNLDGSPQRRVTVLWSADFGGFIEDPARSITDDDGVAIIQYRSEEPGEVTLTVEAIFDHKELQPLSSERTTVHVMPALVEMAPEDQYYSLYQANPAAFRVRLEPAASGYPVTWWLGEQLLATTYTSADGSTGYHRHFKEEQLGEQVITVRSLREGDEYEFKVQVVVPHVRLTAQVGPDSPGIVLTEEARWVFAVDPGLSSDLLVFAERIDGAGDDSARLTITLEDYADPAALGVVFDPPLGETINCDADGKIKLKIDCTNAAFLANSDPHNNHIRLQVTSNLGTTLGLWVGLRYLVSLERSMLQFFRGRVGLLKVAGLGGRLHRSNGDDPMILREGDLSLRLTLEGASQPVDVELMRYGENSTWLYAPLFSTLSGELEPRCLFEPLGNLGKRIQLLTSVYEAKQVISDADLTLSTTANPGLVDDGNTIFIDEGGTYRLTITFSNADGPIVGVPLVPPTTGSGGVSYAASGPTDSKGQVHFEVDARNANLSESHSVQVGIGPFVQNTRIKAFVLVQTDVSMSLDAIKNVTATVHYTRLAGRTFVDDGVPWSVSLDVGSVTYNRLVATNPQGFSVTVADMPTSLPGILRLDFSMGSQYRAKLIEPTEFPITDDMTSADGS
ncbi:MAG TPA: hypothetical protein DIT18_12605 [Pseudomonas sp.]|nr:hypothetical protein [Pseudomonas sp.]